ncbi:hypothetical protein NL676_027244 [Syzygium grande]|nr:hypothetical protein NL676_027244 [Syzygium grande]
MARRRNTDPTKLDPEEMFSEPEIEQMKGHKLESDYVEVECGCTHKRLGDTSGYLRVYKNGLFQINCENKVPLDETPLMKYYQLASNEANHPTKLKFHRDEFVRCSKCKRERRFHLRSKEECRAHHDAIANKRWKCGDPPHDKITCKDAEERAASKRPRGCRRSPICQGCTKCVCFGCLKCRFFDCGCRTCVDYIDNVEP